MVKILGLECRSHILVKQSNRNNSGDTSNCDLFVAAVGSVVDVIGSVDVVSVLGVLGVTFTLMDNSSGSSGSALWPRLWHCTMISIMKHITIASRV